MTPWLWLLAAAATGVAAYLVGWPAWTRSRAREARDMNAERYLAWRGRADRPAAGSMREGPTADERRRLGLAAALGLASAFCLVAFFTSP